MSKSCAPSPDTVIADAQWETLLQRLPVDLDQSALLYEALIRKRQVRSAAILLRLIFAYATGLPLGAVTLWAKAVKLARLSPVALDQRLRRATHWLSHLIAQLLLQRAAVLGGLPLRVRLVDATHAQRPGQQSTDRRLHLGMDLQRLVLDQVRITGPETGESLTHLPVGPGDLALGDRGLASRTGVASVHARQAWVLVRFAWDRLPLQFADGVRCVLAPLLRPLAPGTSQDWAVTVVPTKKIPAIPGRLIAYRLTTEELARARTTRKRKGRKTYKKDRPARTCRDGLETCAYLLLFTTLPATHATTAQVLALYRLRWQIELLIKRLKSILRLDELRAQTEALAQTWLCAKLLLALLSEDLCQTAEVFSP